MEDRTFILPTDDEDGEVAAMVTLAEESMTALARMRTDINAEREEVVAKTYRSLPGARFTVFEITDEELTEEEAEMFYEVFKHASAYMLAEPLRTEICQPRDEAELYSLEVDRARLTFRLGVLEATATWNDLGVDPEDRVRCWFRNCPDGHPEAQDSELVTCHTCRKEMEEFK